MNNAEVFVAISSEELVPHSAAAPLILPTKGGVEVKNSTFQTCRSGSGADISCRFLATALMPISLADMVRTSGWALLCND